jgi:CHAT domain-containing protein
LRNLLEYYDLRAPIGFASQSIDVSEIVQRKEQVLDEHTLVLFYSLGQKRSHLWVLSQTGLSHTLLPDRTQIEDLAAEAHQAMAKSHQRKFKGKWRHAAFKLSRVLLGPVADQLSLKKLAIVADGQLHHVPFAALPNPHADSYRPLVLDHEIVYLPSVAFGVALRERQKNRPPPAKTLAVFADPVFSQDDERLDAPAMRLSGTHEPIAEEAALLREATAGMGLQSFVRLRYTDREARAIAQHVPHDEPYLALGFQANRQNFLDRDWQDYRVLHFSTHGLLHPIPELAGLVLSQYDQAGKPINGFLRTLDLANLQLNADLVVLSACRTAAADDARGEGLWGFSRALMESGAARVIASLWNVQERPTAELFERFYHNLWRERQNPAAALRAAQISMLRERPWQAPYYWAAWLMQGGWDPVSTTATQPTKTTSTKRRLIMAKEQNQLPKDSGANAKGGNEGTKPNGPKSGDLDMKRKSKKSS